jgi:dTMP kinase
MAIKEFERKAKYICIEGLDGTGKSTQMELLVKELEKKAKTVLQTKEPGTARVPLTMKLREISLDNDNSKLLKGYAREFIFQSIRGIHLNHDVYPNLDKVDYIIQDRGILSGLAYGSAFDMNLETLISLNNVIVSEKGHEYNVNTIYDVYDNIVFFTTKQAESFLTNAINAKKEFESGDGIEAEGALFMNKVLTQFNKVKDLFKDKLILINVEDGVSGLLRPKEEILKELLEKINA